MIITTLPHHSICVREEIFIDVVFEMDRGDEDAWLDKGARGFLWSSMTSCIYCHNHTVFLRHTPMQTEM